MVLFHFGIPGFGGGFIGVDVFFVISGFLMTGIIARDLERGKFSIASFYLARAKRILPALLVLCAFLIVGGWFLLMAPDYKTLNSHAVYAIAFLSNVEFWQEAGYFDQASHEKWLLHTWSLSVEWQFYLILPLVLAGVWRYKPGRPGLKLALLAGAVMSFAACVLVTNVDQAAAFYLLPMRAWEMIAGGIVFMMARPSRVPERAWQGIEAAGFVVIAASIAMFDKTSPWPGWRAAVPVIATMAILAARQTSIWTGNALAQWLGTRSYSIYLWHWPMFVALYYLELARDPSALLAGMVATVVLGHMSYLWFEDAPRRLLGKVSQRRAAGAIVLMAVLLGIPAVLLWKQGGVTGRFAQEVELIAAEANNRNPRMAECDTKAGSLSPSCIHGGPAEQVLLVGDSHAGALVSALAAAAPDRTFGARQWTYNACPFVPGLNMTAATIAASPANRYCPGFIDWVESELRRPGSNTPVVFVGRYAAAAFGLNEVDPNTATPRVYFSDVHEHTTPAFLAEFSKAITDSACEIAKTRTVYLMRPIPEIGMDVPKALSRRRAMGVNSEVSIPLSEYRRRNDWVWAAQDAARDRCGVRILDPLPYLCDKDRCYASANGRPLYSDDDHLSESGNKRLIPMFAEVYKE